VTPDQITTSSEPHRLAGRTEPRGSRTGFPTWGAYAFGGIFMVVGILIMLVGLRVIPVDPSGVHAPWWVLTVMGAVFALAGLGVEGMATRQFLAERHRLSAALRHAGNPARQDYRWDPSGFAPPRWSRAVKAVAGAAGLSLFLSIFNYWAFATTSPVMVRMIVVVFDLVLILVWWEAFLRVGRAFKFGGSRIDFLEFPYSIGKPVTIRWQPSDGIGAAQGGHLTLRCVKEWYEQTGSGKNQSTHLVHEEQWSTTWQFAPNRSVMPGKRVDLRFEVPSGLPSTRLGGTSPVFWELEIHLDLPGFDFEETYLVPIYGA